MSSKRRHGFRLHCGHWTVGKACVVSIITAARPAYAGTEGCYRLLVAVL